MKNIEYTAVVKPVDTDLPEEDLRKIAIDVKACAGEHPWVDPYVEIFDTSEKLYMKRREEAIKNMVYDTVYERIGNFNGSEHGLKGTVENDDNLGQLIFYITGGKRFRVICKASDTGPQLKLMVSMMFADDSMPKRVMDTNDLSLLQVLQCLDTIYGPA